MEKDGDTPHTTAYSTKPSSKWTKQDVADWASQVLNFSALPEQEQIAAEKSLQIVFDEGIDGAVLLLYEDRADLKSSLRLLDGHSRKLWAAIEKMNSFAEPVGEIESALRSLSLGDTAEAKNLVRSSVRKKKRQTIIDLLQRSSLEHKATYLADWFEEVVCKDDAVKQLVFDEESSEPQPEPDDGEDFMKSIPLQDRDPALRKLELFCDSRFDRYKGKSKQSHAYLTIFGPSGAGKTRLCFEALKKIEEKAKKKAIPFIGIYLDFSNGARYNLDIDSKLRGGPFLAARVASRLLAGLSYDQFIHYAHTKYPYETVVDIFNQLTLEVVVAAYCRKEGLSRNIAIALVLDEINEVYAVEASDTSLKGFTKQIAIEIGAFMRPSSIINKANREIFPAQQTVLLPVICGTSMDGIDEAIKINGFTRFAPELTLLQKDAIMDCFSKYCHENNKTDLQEKLPKEMCTTILHYFGVIPRGLEYVIEGLQKYSEPSTLISTIHGALEGWFDYTKYEKSFSGTDEAKLYMQLCIIGVSCAFKFPASVQAVINQAKRAGLYYTLSNKFFFCPSILKICNEQFHLFAEDLMPLPGVPFYWQHFECLEAQLEVVKVNTWLSMGMKQVPLTTMFAGANCGLKNVSIQLSHMHYYEESIEFPASKKYTKENNQITSTETIFTLVIQCREANPLIDIRSAYIHGKPVLIVKQLKHGKQVVSDTTQTAGKKSINFKLISVWLEQTQKKLASQGYAEVFRIFYVWITNKKVINVPTILPSNLVLVEKSNVQEYFGPSIALLSNLAKIGDKEQ